MRKRKPFVVIQLRPEEKAAESEFRAILKKAHLTEKEVVRIRGENLNDYAGVIVGGSPFDISLPDEKKSKLQKRIEADFSYLIPSVIKTDFPFLGMCSGNGLLSFFAGGKVSKKFAEPVSGVDIFLTELGKKDKLLLSFILKLTLMNLN